MNDELLTGGVAREAGVTTGTVRLWEKLGLLRARRRVGGVRIFARRDVERFLEQRRAEVERRERTDGR